MGIQSQCIEGSEPSGKAVIRAKTIKCFEEKERENQQEIIIF